MIKREYRYKVVSSCTKSFQCGDIVKPVKKTPVGWLIGHSYHRSLYFDTVDGIILTCESSINPGVELVRLERIK